jgi:hypothetical protein
MTKYLTIILLVFLFSCKKNRSREFNVPERQEITKIIEAVLYQDSLPIFKTNLFRDTIIDVNGNKIVKHSASFPLSTDLRKLNIKVPDTTKNILSSPNFDSISVFRLLGQFGLIKYKPNGKRLIPEKDYNYLLFQNTVWTKFMIKNNFHDSLILTTNAEQLEKRNNGIPRRYYDLTVPIISPDGKKAYIQVTFNCSGTCGDAVAIYLEKKDKKWQIVNRQTLYVS